jgi:hypothetical protein
MRLTICIASVISLVSLRETSAFAPSKNTSAKSSSGTSLFSHIETSRRQILNKSVTAVIAAVATGVLSPLEANATTQTDQENLVKGYKRLQYLLDNWQKETTICGRTDNPYIYNGCERNPEKVMEYLGFKSMKDPLFRADKTMFRLRSMVPADEEDNYIEAMELFSEMAEAASNTAFISSWGESNPGGGKDRVDMFIERSRKQVEVAKDSLGSAIKILGIQA